MKETKLVDRLVVEVQGEQGFPCTPEFIAEQLHYIARCIEEQGLKGSEIIGKRENIGYNLMWEHENESMGFRMGNSSLIHEHYYK